MNYLHEIAWFFNMLSDRCDTIRKLDMDKYKHCTDREVLELILFDKIVELEGANDDIR